MNLDQNPLALANLYPAAGGITTGMAGSANTPATPAQTSEGIIPTSARVLPLERAAQISIAGNPLGWWFALALLLGLLMGLTRYFGGGAAFSNIKLSLYNVVVIALAGIVGGAILKVFAARWPVPGLSTIVLAS